MYDKYRLYLTTTRKNYFVAGSDTVNDLVSKALQWLEQGGGQDVRPHDTGKLELRELDEKSGSYVRSKVAGVSDPEDVRKDIIRKIRELGGR